MGLDGTTLRPFEKPLTTTWFMFLAMAMGKSVGGSERASGHEANDGVAHR